MQGLRKRRMLMAVVGRLALIAVSLGVLIVSPAIAQQSELEVNVPVAQPPPPDDSNLSLIALFTDEISIQVTDLSGKAVGEGMHGGRIGCNGNTCSQKTLLQFTGLGFPEYEYKFSTRQSLDPVEERVVVAGTGIISRRGQKERFSFSATFQNNRDGTVSVTYVASRPDASFAIERAPAGFLIFSRP